LEIIQKNLPIVDLQGQYKRLKHEIDAAILEVLDAGNFIQGAQVKSFAGNLARYLGCEEVIPCANGTDALQIAYIALDLKPGDEVVMPAFNYVAAAEAAALMGLKPVFADVLPGTFNLDPEKAEAAIGPKTRAIVPVHLFGQACDMDAIMEIAQKHGLFVIEDNAQAIGAQWNSGKYSGKKLGTIGHIGTTSFFPSKNLGCMGDGGALTTRDSILAEKIRKICNHGQSTKYRYERIGVNSRLDTLQAAILEVKLRHLDDFIAARQKAASHYDSKLKGISGIIIPERDHRSTHVFHQYTIRTEVPADRDKIKKQLEMSGIQSMIYYPKPLHMQEGYHYLGYGEGAFPVSNGLCASVLSLPMHTELDEEKIDFICQPLMQS
jgi:UDP-2-acetamido-2-deoxy-ribo-hexuluronate aminotransferase